MNGATLATDLRICRVCDHTMTTYRGEHPRFHHGRGLCNICRQRASRRGELADHERITRSRDDFLDEWRLLCEQGHTRSQIAERLGMSVAAVSRALDRARAAGDPRAVPAVRADIRAPHKAVRRAA